MYWLASQEAIIPPKPLSKVNNSRGARSIQRIVHAAARMFGKDGFQAASMGAVARAAGVSKGLLHYHFRSKEHLLVEAVRATFRQVYRRFDERFQRGERGLEPALEALDALWAAIREMSGWAPFMVETMSLAVEDGPLRDDVTGFMDEANEMLERGIQTVFADDLERLAVPPDRLTHLVRVSLNGLVVELAHARTEEERAEVDVMYADLRDLFSRVAYATPTTEAP